MNNFLYRVVVVWAGLAAFGARADQGVINEDMYQLSGVAPEWTKMINIPDTRVAIDLVANDRHS